MLCLKLRAVWPLADGDSIEEWDYCSVDEKGKVKLIKKKFRRIEGTFNLDSLSNKEGHGSGSRELRSFTGVPPSVG